MVPLCLDHSILLARDYLSIEVHFVLHIVPLYFPWILVAQPILGLFELLSVVEDLFEYAIVVPDSVAPSREVQSRQGV